jgi:hypothetical protein
MSSGIIPVLGLKFQILCKKMKEELAPMTIPQPLMHEQGAQDSFKIFKSQGFTLKARTNSYLFIN